MVRTLVFLYEMNLDNFAFCNNKAKIGILKTGTLRWDSMQKKTWVSKVELNIHKQAMTTYFVSRHEEDPILSIEKLYNVSGLQLFERFNWTRLTYRIYQWDQHW